jgi:hypothetical protein
LEKEAGQALLPNQDEAFMQNQSTGNNSYEKGARERERVKQRQRQRERADS